MPVSQHEYLLDDDKTIVSTTDLQGNINYANPYFIEVSGFTQEELIGAPQNIVRLPTCRWKRSPTCGAPSRTARRGPAW
ncbi:MAG TPA: PAS domain S-box protein [Burkholderiaceae bacterium]|nr:PAS domain S-box protein [Burkholderiaceae bacterium]